MPKKKQDLMKSFQSSMRPHIIRVLTSTKTYHDPMPKWAISAAHNLMLEMFPDEFLLFYTMLFNKNSWYDLDLIMTYSPHST